jgi:3-phenylpropionate/trans-cinnamate dioxygenase ferredoxin reductase subunit
VTEALPTDRNTFVIVGGGLAGAKAAETLRAEGFDRRLVLLGAEPELPYERPPLSKSYLAGESTLAEARVHDRSFYDDHAVELLTGREAVTLDAAAREVGLADGSTLGYDRLLIATGAVPRRPPIEGADRDGVSVLRTVADSDRLRQVIERGGRLAVIGAGWIGSEVAATARSGGADVTLIAQAETPLQRVLGKQIGQFFADLHRRHGVQLLAGAQAERIEDGPKVVLADGTAIEADAVVLGVGVAPAVALAETGGLRVHNGVVTDERLRTSSDRVFAAGDVAAAYHPRYGRRIRVEHWANAGEQGAAAARSMLGADDAYAKVPFFFSDQYDVGMEYFGLHGPGDRLVLRGSIDSGTFQAFWAGSDGTVTAGMHVNDWDASEAIGRLVETGARTDLRELADVDVPLEHLASQAA